MGEVFFYHLTRRPLEAVLPGLLRRTLDAGWRAVVRAGSPERVESLDRMLWSYADDSFLPHGAADAGFAERQPIYLTAGDETPNRPDLLFLVDGVAPAPGEVAEYRRICVLFDARDERAVGASRQAWKALADAGAAAVYWAETETGGWERRAETEAAKSAGSG